MSDHLAEILFGHRMQKRLPRFWVASSKFYLLVSILFAHCQENIFAIRQNYTFCLHHPLFCISVTLRLLIILQLCQPQYRATQAEPLEYFLVLRHD